VVFNFLIDSSFEIVDPAEVTYMCLNACMYLIPFLYQLFAFSHNSIGYYLVVVLLL
jgi:hypothetical protein